MNFETGPFHHPSIKHEPRIPGGSSSLICTDLGRLSEISMIQNFRAKNFVPENFEILSQPIKDRQGLIPTSELTRPNSQSKQKEVEFQNKFLELTKVNGSNPAENTLFNSRQFLPKAQNIEPIKSFSGHLFQTVDQIFQFRQMVSHILKVS